MQETDEDAISASDLKVVTTAQPTPEQVEDMLFAWKVCKHVKSNAIVLAKDGQAIGVGAGQMNRVGSLALPFRWQGKSCQFSSGFRRLFPV